MAEIIPKGSVYDIVDSKYLTAEPFAHEMGIDLEIEVYDIYYDWGRTNGYYDPDTTHELKEPLYIGKLEGIVTAANFTLDSTSDMRSTCSLSIILEANSPFIVQAEDYTDWEKKWFRIIKKYNYLNDVDMYPRYKWDDKSGLWNNNGLVDSDPSESVLGWFIPNEGSFSYNSETREFSMSCTDIMSCFTESRGGHLSTRFEGWIGYNFYETAKAYDNSVIGNINDDIRVSAERSSGFLMEGEKNHQIADKQYNNYFAQASTQTGNVSPVWSDSYSKYSQETSGSSAPNYNNPPHIAKQGVAGLVQKIAGEYTNLAPVSEINVRLQNDWKSLPFDIDINGDTSLLDVLKKITELYPRQFIYFDTNRALNVMQWSLAWHEPWDKTVFRSRECAGFVLEEHWNVSYENIKNYVAVFGRDQTYYGYYYITSYKGMCEKCGRIFDYPAMPSNENWRHCPVCGKDQPLRRLFVTDESFCVQQIGTHKEVIFNDNLTTEQECFDAAKAICLESCRAKKTLSVTLADRYLSIYQRADKGIGHRIEYTSKLTGETDIYTLVKWSNDFTAGTVTMELEPYYTCRDEYASFSDAANKDSCVILPLPSFTYEVDVNGLMTMIINNGWFTKHCLFKVYVFEIFYEPDETTGKYDFWFDSIAMRFLGETCEVYSEETETQCQTKVLRYQFNKNGKYIITCQAWSPNIHPSSCPEPQVVEVNCFKDRLITHDGLYITTHNGDRILCS